MGTTRNTAYTIKVDRLQDEAGLNIEEGALHVHNNKLKAHLNGQIVEVQTGAAAVGSGAKVWRYKNSTYLTSASALNLKGEANPVNLIADTTVNFKSVNDDIITTDFDNNEDAITPELDKIYRFQINFNLDVEVNDNTVELALREAISGDILQLGNVDSSKNVDTAYCYTFPLIKATPSIVTNGLHIDFLDVTSGGSFVNIYNIIVSIEEIGTAI